MPPADESRITHGEGSVADGAAAEVQVLGQLLAAQTALAVLPTARHIAEFYARALACVPGVTASRVCLPGASAQEGEGWSLRCASCEEVRNADEGGLAISRDFACKLEGQRGVDVFPLQTAGTRFGFFVVLRAGPEPFERYRPFLANLGNFVALSLENREQRAGLLRSREALERTVAERTAELLAANRRLGEEIGERTRAEAAIRRLNEELEGRVLERTAQLEAANRELEAFAYSVSHDLRSPLRHIGGFAELLHRRTAASLDETSRRHLAAISEAAARLGQLVDDLLSFSRMGRAELSRAPVDLGNLVREVIRGLDPETHGRVVSWHIGELPVVSGDRALLRVALVNLLSNALKFTRPRPVAEITIGLEASAGAEVILLVRDNGVGFDMAHAGKLFGVFERLHRAAEFEGTGIGLANVRRVVERHGGRIWAQGAIDGGATFYVALPTSPSAPSPSRPGTSSGPTR